MNKTVISDLTDVRSTVLGAVTSMLAYWDRDLRCGFANLAYETWFGRHPQSLIGTALVDLLGPELFLLNKPHIDAVLSGREQIFERAIPAPGGGFRPSLARYTPIFIDGNVVGFVVEVSDITALQDAQQGLRQQIANGVHAAALLRKSETALMQAQKLGRIGSWQWEVGPDITIWSEALYLILERDSTRMPPPFSEHEALYTPQSWQLLQQAVRQTLRIGHPYVLELEYIRSDGSTGWLECRGTGERDEAGNVDFLHGTVQEISYRKRDKLTLSNDSQLVQLRSELKAERIRCDKLEVALAHAKKTETLGILSATIAHDFNNVLAVVGGALHIVKNTAQDARSQNFVERGLRGIDRAARLVRQLMDFARRRPLESAQIDPAIHLDNCKELFALSLDPVIKLRFKLHPCGMVNVDPAQLEVAVINLLVNARHAMPNGGHVTIFTKPCNAGLDPQMTRDGWLTIGVRDTGIGMTPDVLRCVRQPFFTTRGSVGGTGMGLAMVDAFARTSNGYLEIKSRPEEGTVVFICLPRARVLPAATK